MNRWDAYVEDPGTSREQRELRRIGRDNQMVLIVEEKITDGYSGYPGMEEEDFGWGFWDADEDLFNHLPFDSTKYQNYSEPYQDGYTARWFPVHGEITCGLRADLPRKQRVHDYVSLGKDFKNKGVEGIVEVIVFACSVCGRDWR